ncbi:MAG: MATE family efflux transporter [Oscillospiraceae bacterium]|nr:MATE family efflux transporter [Oscillospiraceae bacterium]
MKKTNDLGKDSIISLVLKLAVPAMLAQLVNVLYTAVDRMFIGNIPDVGDIALAGIGVCAPLAEFLASWGNLIGVGGSVYMAIKMGEGDNKKAEKILSNSFQSLIVMSVVLTVIFLLTKEQLIWWFGASSETFGYANRYLTIYTCGAIFAIMAIGMNYFISCQGFPAVSMASVIIGAVTNIILDYLFVFVMGWQVEGAAIATVIAQFLSCTWTLVFLFGKRIHIKIKKHSISPQILVKICKLGLSPFIMYSTNSVMVIILNVVLAMHGGEVMGDRLISAATIVQSYALIILNPLGGITAGTQAIISYNYGAGNYRRVIEALNKITAVAVAFCAVMFVVSRFVPQYVAMLYTNEQEIIDLAVYGMKAYTIGLIPLALHYEATDGLTALGMGGTALAMSAFRKVTFVALMFAIPAFLPPQNTFYFESVGDICCGLINTVACILILRKVFRAKGCCAG